MPTGAPGKALDATDSGVSGAATAAAVAAAPPVAELVIKPGLWFDIVSQWTKQLSRVGGVYMFIISFNKSIFLILTIFPNNFVINNLKNWNKWYKHSRIYIRKFHLNICN